MTHRVPPDFDAVWYASTYPDVGLSGLDPREHYRLFGGRFGRAHKAPAAAKPSAVEARPTKRPEPQPASPERDKPEASAIVAPPADFDPTATLTQPAPARSGSGDDHFTLDGISKGRGGVEVTPALGAYAQLLGLETVGIWGADTSQVSCGSEAFQSGPSRIENAWLAGSERLRLMLTGEEAIAPGSRGWVFRAYQARPASPAELSLLGPGIQLPSLGPVIHDVELVHPFMPLLLELADSQDVTRAIALMPFPSLLPGGLHWAELKAFQADPKPMDDFWELSNRLLREATAGRSGRERGGAGLSVSWQGAATNGEELEAPIEEWLSTVFGIAASGGTTVAGGCRLVLPPDFVPTIGALVSRGLRATGSDAVSGPYLIAEADDYRPRWSVALPADLPVNGLRPIVECAGKSAGVGANTSLALGIAVRPALAQRAAEASTASARSGAMTVVVNASSMAAVERTQNSLRSALGAEIHLLVQSDDCDADTQAELDRMCAERGWARVPSDAALQKVAREAAPNIVLTISDRVDPGDGSAVRTMLDILQSDETAASVSCGLVAETLTKKQAVRKSASAGLFPTGTCCSGAPDLSFAEPDALQALPDATYPVVANTFHFTVWRRHALAELELPATNELRAGEDLRLGLGLVRAGHRNWCTTKVTAKWVGVYAPRGMIDPTSVVQIDCSEWEDILSRVTILRELF